MAVECPSCGSANEDWASYCTNCGQRLSTAAPAPASVPTYPEVRSRERTKTGLLLLVVGFVLSAVPIVNVVAIFVLIAAVILLLLGASPFGGRHRRFVVISVILFLVIFVAIGVLVANLLFQFVLTGITGAPLELPEPAWRSFVIGVGIASAAFAVPYLLITYELQDLKGRQMLWVAGGVQVAGSGLNVWYSLPLAGSFTGEIPAFQVITGDPVSYLFALTALPWAFAYYLAYRRLTAPPVAPPSTGAPGVPQRGTGPPPKR